MLDGTSEKHTVWMSHFDAITEMPDGFTVTASTPDAPVAAFEDTNRGFYGVQYHPEVVHTEHGQQVIERFLADGCKATQTWTMASVIDTQVDLIQQQVGDEGRVLCALSGLSLIHISEPTRPY